MKILCCILGLAMLLFAAMGFIHVRDSEAGAWIVAFWGSIGLAFLWIAFFAKRRAAAVFNVVTAISLVLAILTAINLGLMGLSGHDYAGSEVTNIFTGKTTYTTGPLPYELHTIASIEAISFMILPVIWIGRKAALLRRSRLEETRRSAGQCSACGYDLRGSVDRCPECGTPVQQPT